VTDGKPWLNSFVVARSHWGTAVATTLSTRTMQIPLECGHRTIEATIRSNNAASLRLALKLGWKSRFRGGTYLPFVRKL
jgi:RimJ/RimL family protein N-acetyltransferase